MSVTRDITATYTGPARVVRRLLSAGPREDRALAIVMAACAVVFVSTWPKLARDAHITGQELSPMLGGALMAWLFIMPLALYAIGLAVFLVLRAFSNRADPYAIRLALFWALLASSPLILLNGLVAGFIGPGLELSLVGGLWMIVFLWFWIRGTAETLKGGAGD